MTTITGCVSRFLSRLLAVLLLPGTVLFLLSASGQAVDWAADKPFIYTNPSDMWQRHTAILAAVKKTPDARIVFIGDSITQFWEGKGKAVWDRYYAPRKALNLGVSGDRTNGCMWRLENGELDGIKPKLAVILIGTNNTWGDEMPVDASARGTRIIVETVRRKLPDTEILLLAIFPREDPNTNGKYKLLNQAVSGIKFDAKVHYLDIGKQFLDDNGKIARGFEGDKLHLSAEGYQIWAAAIEAGVAKVLGDTPVAPPKPGG